MPPRRKFDKKTATTFQLVHRAQNDPLIHDENAQMVFQEKASTTRRPTEDDYAHSDVASQISGTSEYRSDKTRQRGDLEDEFGMAVRRNEGEAAEHGVFYDDTSYDYMQHMRDLGGGEGAVTWVEAKSAAPQKKKGKQSLADALRGMELGEGEGEGEHSVRGSVAGDSVASSSARSLLPEEVLPSEFVKKFSYQDQQDVPDEIAGFQPDMDPRLREVLEALEDEEYVDDDEDLLAELTSDGYEVERDEWERLGEQQVFDDEDEEGWESDHTIRAASPPPPLSTETLPLDLPIGEAAVPPEDVQAQPPADPTQGAWLDEFKKFKQAAKTADRAADTKPAATPSALDASVMSSLASGRRKKRKGAKTSTTNYSMTSSALARTDQQSLLDDRFDKLIDKGDALDDIFEDEESISGLPDNASLASGLTSASKASRISRYSTTSGMSGMSDSEAPQLIRTDFDNVMDEFLGAHSKAGKRGRYLKRVGPQSGMEQLDEVRKGLGPARLKSRVAGS
ncbi:Protein ltv1 [Recurvomyces mirabilis]|uniref:Protein ltv1 n=1 Tax=Recurvomyces mirabilis TaxID=574656 RepID=A0AAE0WS00_9PEZI|nr:Protein ltv1 [Recurvomyces mirabilis]KAK5154937.1 Protein ltv1 [Recurvomyces mirabilis]